MMNQVKTQVEIERIRVSGRMLAEVLRLLAPRVVAGVTTGELGDVAAHELKALGGKPAFLGYRPSRDTRPFPSVICISVNDEVVHGIPGSRRLAEGDIVGLDFGVNYEGMFTDGAITVPVGSVRPAVAKLLKATREALDHGIFAVRAGGQVGDISAAVETRLRRDHLGIVEDLSGHGVGHQVHEEPNILNVGRAGTGPVLKAGMTLAIEPMATLGGRDVVLEDDGWTIKTADGSLGAQFEHTVLVTEDGAEILTQ
jgi:methionyl aminopeptidase